MMLSSQSKKKKPSKKMRRKQRGEVLVAPEIPLDLQFEILKRLPVKSLARFKCVSKCWSSLIHSQGYLFPSPPRLYINLVKAPGKFALLSLASTSKSTAFDLDMIMDGVGGYLLLALRGLILYIFYRQACIYNPTTTGQACIYNPTTGQRVTLPLVINILAEKESHDDYFYFLGYDPVLDQYKVIFSALVWSVERIYAKHWVFVLEAGSSWKRIEFDYPHFPLSKLFLCIKGVIYYLANSDVSVSGDNNIISFDVRSEEFNKIQLPHEMSDYLEIIEYCGKPTIFDYIHLHDPSGLLNLWVLENAGKWSKKSLVLQPCHMHFFPSSIPFEVIGTTRNGEVVLKPEVMFYPYYILYYDLHKNVVRRVDIRRIFKKPFDLVLMDTGESILHLKI